MIDGHYCLFSNKYYDGAILIISRIVSLIFIKCKEVFIDFLFSNWIWQKIFIIEKMGSYHLTSLFKYEYSDYSGQKDAKRSFHLNIFPTL